MSPYHSQSISNATTQLLNGASWHVPERGNLNLTEHSNLGQLANLPHDTIRHGSVAHDPDLDAALDAIFGTTTPTPSPPYGSAPYEPRTAPTFMPDRARVPGPAERPQGYHVIAGGETLHQRLRSYGDSLWTALAFSGLRDGRPVQHAAEPQVLRWTLLQLLVAQVGKRYATAVYAMLDHLQDQLNHVHRYLGQLLQEHPRHHAALWDRAKAVVADTVARVAFGAPPQPQREAFENVLQDILAAEVREARPPTVMTTPDAGTPPTQPAPTAATATTTTTNDHARQWELSQQERAARRLEKQRTERLHNEYIEQTVFWSRYFRRAPLEHYPEKEGIVVQHDHLGWRNWDRSRKIVFWSMDEFLRMGFFTFDNPDTSDYLRVRPPQGEYVQFSVRNAATGKEEPVFFTDASCRQYTRHAPYDADNPGRLPVYDNPHFNADPESWAQRKKSLMDRINRRPPG